MTPAYAKNTIRRALTAVLDVEPTRLDVSRLWQHFEARCAYCDRRLSRAKREAHLDHVVSTKLGGRNHVSNRVLSCARCNGDEKREGDWLEFLGGKTKDPAERRKRAKRIKAWMASNVALPFSSTNATTIAREIRRAIAAFDSALVNLRKLRFRPAGSSRAGSSDIALPASRPTTEASKEREAAASRYKPKRIKTLLVAEAPPSDVSRYFYFDDVVSNDWLFRGVVEVLFRAKPERSAKAQWLARLKKLGVFLIDLKLDPIDGSDLALYVPDLVSRCISLKPERVILIKATVYDVAYASLSAERVPVIDKRIPFPSHGQQERFRRQFEAALAVRRTSPRRRVHK